MAAVARDRTREFEEIVKTLSKQSNIDRKGDAFRAKSERTRFTVEAQQIAKGIHETTSKLKVLTGMVKKSSALFDQDRIHQSIAIIKDNITRLNGQIDGLQAIVDRKNEQTEKHTTNILNTLRMQLADRTKDFKGVVEATEKKSKKQRSLEIEYDYKRASTSTSPHDANGSSEVVIQMPLQQTALGSYDYETERLRAAQGLHTTIVELQDLFGKFAHTLAEQQDLIDRIDVNANETNVNLGLAQSQLLDYMRKVSSNRQLMIKIFLVLIFFVVIFTVFFV
eukprot:TRINITY_DN9568_c0_g1_i1.p1 TRINITY_DN9568_c0_g1~~TRINITY_DN9568_c0_g1_i1.p1  ORF type:complete len:280 (+),score=70.18 TRINITY_DN9568_c0_g1_i1:58-897(+)